MRIVQFFKPLILVPLTIVALVVTLSARLTVEAIDFVFPKRVREVIPLIDVQRTMILAIAQGLSSPERKQVEEAIEELKDFNDDLGVVVKGYPIRKTIGNTIDNGLTIAILGGLGVAAYLSHQGVPYWVIGIFASSVTAMLATVAGFFGPLHAISREAKEVCLTYGNYKGALFFQSLEELFEIPFVAARSSFMILDLPPIDGESLEDFKEEISERINTIQGSLESIIGVDESRVPETMANMLNSLLESTEMKLGELDFRMIQESVAREFALVYYKIEFPIFKRWNREEALEEFARQFRGMTKDDAREIIKLLSYKISQGQLDEDLVNSVMIAGALKGIISKEQEHHEMFSDLQLNQVAVALAIGAKQFMKDHYALKIHKRTVFHWLGEQIKLLLVFLLAVPIALGKALFSWLRYVGGQAKRWIKAILRGTPIKYAAFRAKEIYIELERMPTTVKTMIQEKKEAFFGKKEGEEEQKQQGTKETSKESTVRENKEESGSDVEETKSGWGSKIKSVLVSILKIIFILPYGIYSLIRNVIIFFLPKEKDPRERFQEEVAHAALVYMYRELYEKLSLSSHVSTAF